MSLGETFLHRSVILVALLVVAAPAAAQETFSLERAINYSLGNSAILEASEQQLRQADQLVREAWGSALPDISVSASYQRNHLIQEAFLPAIIFDPTASPEELVPVRFGSDNQWNAGFSFSQPLFQMDVFHGVGAAGRFRSFQREILRNTAQSVVMTIRTAYLSALLAEERLQLAEKSAGRVRSTLHETRARARAGVVSDYDVLRIEVELANIESELRRSGRSTHTCGRDGHGAQCRTVPRRTTDGTEHR
ncbi:MAG: TolC family protein [Gemmatimonadales bacterium]